MARPKRFSKLSGGIKRVASYTKRKVLRRDKRHATDYVTTHATNGSNKRRVVITGIGAITVLGLNTLDTWNGLVNGQSGIGPITQFDASHLPVRIAGEVKGFEATRYIEPKEARRMARCSHFAIAAGQEALAHAGLRIAKDVHPDRVGVVMGTALGGYEMSDYGAQEYRRLGWRRANPFALPAALPNAPGHHISTFFGAKGPLSTVVAACASGTQAIGEAAELIRNGKIDAAFAGGVEATVIEPAIVAFNAMRVLSS